MIQRPLAFYIGLRYTRAKRRNRSISFISLISILCIALGVTVLTTVLSVMNGFDFQIRNKLFSIVPAVTIYESPKVKISDNWQNISHKIRGLPQVVASAPFVDGKGMLTNQGLVSGVDVIGILPSAEIKINEIAKKIVTGSLASLQSGKFNMVIGKKLAAALGGLQIGDKVTLYTPQTVISPLGAWPRIRRFTVTGIFSTHSGFGFDQSLAYINLYDAEKLYPPGAMAVNSGLHVKILDIYKAQAVTAELQSMLPIGYMVSNWTYQYGPLFKALAMEKTMMFVLLLFILAVATFNLVSILLIIVKEKRADIAILRTLGASPTTIMLIFVVQGGIIGAFGTLLGLVGGIILSLNATDIVNSIQHFFNIQFLSSSVYFVDYLPSRLQWQDIVSVGCASMALSLLATIIPALVAFRTQPAEALRYE